jgi:nucleotide-binding universal stress UspA family protein
MTKRRFDSEKNPNIMQKILVPCDFSRQAINAYRFALDTAKQSNGELHLLNVVEVPVVPETMFVPSYDFAGGLFDELQTRAQVQFDKLKSSFATDHIKIYCHIQFGTVSHTIQEYVQQESIDLIVMGSHGANGLREFFIGSNAEKIVRTSQVPVLVIKEYFDGPVKNIVFPNTLDTQNQEDLVMKVKALQHFFTAQLHIVWINTPLNFAPDSFTRQRLQAFAKRFMLKDYVIHVCNALDEESGILDFTKSIKGDLIAMGTHGRRGVSHLLNGSVAEDVANHNKGLVWTYTLKSEPVNSHA